MKILTIILFTPLFFFFASCNGAIYKWTDKAGKIHFDSNGANIRRSEYISLKKLQSVKWKISKVRFSSTSKSINKQQVEYNKQLKKKCTKTSKRMRFIKKKLVKPLIAEQFDAFQAELRTLRWTKRKVC